MKLPRSEVMRVKLYSGVKFYAILFETFNNKVRKALLRLHAYGKLRLKLFKTPLCPI